MAKDKRQGLLLLAGLGSVSNGGGYQTKPNQTRQTANPMELIISVTSETLAKHKRREVMDKEYTIRGADVEWIH